MPSLPWMSRPAPAPNSSTDGDSGFHEIHHYRFAHWFELSVEVINTGAGLIILFALILGVVNLFIVAYNAATDKELMLINPLHSGHGHVATVGECHLCEPCIPCNCLTSSPSHSLSLPAQLQFASCSAS